MISDKLSKANSMKAFFAIGIPLALAKFFQETLYVMSYFMEKDFGVSSAIIYQTAKYQPLGVAIGYLATAFLVDQFGIKKILSFNMIFMGIALLGFSQNHNFEMLLFYRISLGVFIGTIYNCSFGALPVIFDTHELPKKTSILYMFAFLSAMVAPQILTITEPWFTWRTLMMVSMVVTVISGLAVAKYFPQKTQPISYQQYTHQVKKLLQNKVFLLMVTVSTLCMGGFYGFVALFVNNLQHLGIGSDISKFIVTDMQFIGRVILFTVTTISSVKLTQKAIPGVLKTALTVMGLAAIMLSTLLFFRGSLFGDTGLIDQLVNLATNRMHVFSALLSMFSGIWLFWIYAGLIGVAQPANKAKALSIAGRSMSGSAQAIIGFSLSIGEFIFAILASYRWPMGAYSFLIFTAIAAFVVIGGLIKFKAKL